MALKREQYWEWAKAGASARVKELQAEIDTIRRAFGRGRKAATPRRRKRRVSAAQRRATSRRMKKLWAERRKAKKASK